MYNAKYWETEAPEVLRTGSAVFRYYAKAGRLIVAKPDWLDPKTGEIKSGKGIAVNLESLDERPEVAKRLIEIIESTLPPQPEYIPPKE